MSRFLLDTDTLSLYQRGHPVVTQKIMAQPVGDVAVAVISVEEQLTGWYTRVRRAKKRTELADVYQRLANAIRFLASLPIASFPEPAIIRYEGLRKVHRGAGKNDLRIASIALEFGMTIVTCNTRDFRQIAGLLVEDWSV